MGSYHEMEDVLKGLREIDMGKLRGDIERGITFLNRSTSIIEDYLARFKINPTNHERKPYEIQRGGRQ